ncbi:MULTISPECIES: hypothetical protein [unclassified Wolbachia]|uniref:hypothetical protein n=1 Tax=unclassified Wolbachia TaxID=2640676 RepID=UPI002231E547|nr:hypothetical protein [Wolbachia endosymbiont (group A) of Apoderus coryli]
MTIVRVSSQCSDTDFHPRRCHPSAQTLGSRKICLWASKLAQTMVTTFSMRLYGKLDPSVKHWDDKVIVMPPRTVIPSRYLIR